MHQSNEVPAQASSARPPIVIVPCRTGWPAEFAALTRYHANDVDVYYDVKDPVCDIIMAGAEVWAAATHWQPEPADI